MIDVEFVTACKYQIVAKWQYKQTFCYFEILTSYCVLPIGMKLYIKTNDIGPNNLNTLQKNNLLFETGFKLINICVF